MKLRLLQFRRALTLSVVVVLSVLLPGCVPDQKIRQLLGFTGKQIPVSVNTPHGKAFVGMYMTHFDSMGSLSQYGTKFSGKGVTATGTLNFRLVHPDQALQQAFGQFAKGAWHSIFDFTGDTATGSATATGIALARYTPKGAGEICVRAIVQYRNRGRYVTNRFLTLGGTGNGATVRASGAYMRKANPNGSVSVNASASATVGKSIALPARCRQLETAFRH